MLLLLSNSLDGSSDVICSLCVERELDCFRFNVDLFADYEFRWCEDGFRIEAPSGRSVSSDKLTVAYWRKPHFLGDPKVQRIGSSGSEMEWAEAQVQYIVNEVANWCQRKGVLRLVEARAERRFGKISQMLLASRYFAVPPWETGWGKPLAKGLRIVKSLDARLIEDNQFLYARSVDASRLDPRFPWLFQDVASGTHDATVVFVAGECFGFKFATPRAEGHEDWRKTINTPECIWVPWELSPDLIDSIRLFMTEARLKFGRLDFIVGPGGVCFLEVNPNGQFGWLDDANLRIHRCVLDSLLDPETAVL